MGPRVLAQQSRSRDTRSSHHLAHYESDKSQETELDHVASSDKEIEFIEVS